jgi:hypothetical protein
MLWLDILACYVLYRLRQLSIQGIFCLWILWLGFGVLLVGDLFFVFDFFYLRPGDWNRYSTGFSGHGGKILFVTCFVLLPIGIALFGSSEAWEAFSGKDEED